MTGRAAGITAALSFSWLLAGSNALTPLLPGERDRLGLSPLVLSLTYVCYVGSLVAVLLAMAQPGLLRHARALVVSSLVAQASADALLAVPTESTLLLGRTLTGVAGGLGTGAAAALVVAGLGEAGRPVSATGNLVGAVVGTGLALVATWTLDPHALVVTFLVHLSGCLVLTAVWGIGHFIGRPDRITDEVARMGSFRPVAQVLRAHAGALGVGCVSWIATSSTIVYLPSLLADRGLPDARDASILSMLAVSALGQLLSPRLSAAAPRISGMCLLSAGAFFVTVGAWRQEGVIVLVGCLALGGGGGVAYRLALVVLTAAAPPALHGALSSAYAAITYLAAAVAVLMTGVTGNVVGLPGAAAALAGLLVLTTVLLFRVAPRLETGRAAVA